jgi:capsular polysaccharide biosynthesis protein/uncharacterized small protein (DUF1192 family)
MSASRAATYDEGRVILDLGHLARSIWRGWPIIVALIGIGALFGAAGGQALRLAAPRYGADAQLVLTGSKYRVNLDPKFTTVEILSAASATASRPDEYRAIINSAETRAIALEQVKNVRDISPALLEEARQSSVRPEIRGNLITLRVTAPSPEAAALVANAYASAVVTRLDEVYATSDQDLKALEQKLAEAIAANEAAEAALVRFLETSPLPQLTRRIDQQGKLLDTLNAERRGAIEAQVARSYTMLATLDQLYRDGIALQEQVNAGSQSPATRSAAAVSLFLLRRNLAMLATNALPPSNDSTNSSNPPQLSRNEPTLSLQIDLSTLVTQQTTQQALLADIQVFLQQIERRRAEVLEELANSASVLATLPKGNDNQLTVDQLGSRDAAIREAIAGLSADLARKESERKAAEFRLETLLNEVKLTKDSRQALATKVQESAIAAASSGRAIVVAAALPYDAYPSLLIAVSLGAVGGLVVGSVVVLARQRRRP